MTPLERARDVMARYWAGKPDETPPLVKLIAEAIEQAEKEARSGSQLPVHKPQLSAVE